MDNVDRFYLDCASGAVAVLFDAQNGCYYIDGDDRKYVDPAAFEAHLRTLPPQLWAPEFRSAYATIQGYINRNSDQGSQDITDALVMAANCVRTLAKTYCPEIAQELGELHTSAAQPTAQEPQSETEKRTVNETTKSVSRPALPAGIKDTPAARAAFDSLVDAGYLDNEYKPTASASKNVVCAYMAATLNQLLGVDHWVKVFANFWGVPNLSQSYNQLNPGKQFITDIDKALAAAARNCEQLAQTKRGKELLGKK